jgi:beta-xylosidase
VYDGHESDPTIEGPKFYKRHGYYYIFAPAGGVSTGWQLVLRSKNIYGPYERRVVMDQGHTIVNGPHQGAWVTTQKGEDWFLHFQDKEAYGRVVHLQPMKWVNDWPVIGNDPDGDGKGEPVLRYRKPDVGTVSHAATPATTDEFNDGLGKQWQWMANPQPTWYFMNPFNHSLRLYSYPLPDSAHNLWDAPNVLLQKFPADEFMVTAKISFQPNPKLENEKAGLVIMGMSYANLALKSGKNGTSLVYSSCIDAIKGNMEKETVLSPFKESVIYLRVKVESGARCSFSYSLDGKIFIEVPEQFTATPGRWTGARVGLFCTRQTTTNDAGWADVDWFRVEPVK